MYRLGNEQRAVVERTRAVANDVIASHAVEVDARSAYPSESMDALAQARLLGLLVPREHGGMGHGLRTMAAVVEEVARACPSTAMCYVVHLGGAATYSAAPRPDAGRLEAVARGEHVSTLALGEFGSRSHFWVPTNVGVSAIALGIAESTIETIARHLSTARLQHLDMSLADLPNQRARLARMRLETDRARAHLAAVLDSLESPGPATVPLVLESKVSAGEVALNVTDLAMRAAGGTGFSRKMGIERALRDARALQVVGVTDDLAHEFIGRALCGMPIP